MIGRIIIALVVLATALQAGQDSLYVPDIETFMKVGYAGSPTISQDGEQVFFTTASTGVNQIYRLNEAGWPYQLTLFDDGTDWYILSYDATKLIVGASVGGDENSQLYLVNAMTGRLQKLTDKPEVRYGSVIFSPDNSRIYYYSNELNGRDFHIWSMNPIKNYRAYTLILILHESLEKHLKILV